jgi:hypothetical protein
MLREQLERLSQLFPDARNRNFSKNLNFGKKKYSSIAYLNGYSNITIFILDFSLTNNLRRE